MTTVHAPVPVAEATPPGVPARLVLLRTAFRNGLITLGEFLAFVDRFLDGIPLGDIPVPNPPPPEAAKEHKS